MNQSSYPIAIVGAGPVGLAAAAELLERGLLVKVYEASDCVGANLRDWAHVRLFSPWTYNMSEPATRMLALEGWRAPEPDAFPTGGDLLNDYLLPLSRVRSMKSAIETGARVLAISREGLDKVGSRGRESRPFELLLRTAEGERRDLASAVVDASGTWSNPNPMGANGLPAKGEAGNADRIAYGIPDVLGRDRRTYAGRSTLVIGAGYSAADILLDLALLAREDSGERRTPVPHWITRSDRLERLFGGGLEDQLPARGALGSDIKGLVDRGDVALHAGFAISEVSRLQDGLAVFGTVRGERRNLGPFDRIVVATGQRPDLELTRELRLRLDPWLESVEALGPLIDPNLHSCGSVPPHGHREVSHPEPGFYTIGVKSYGRAPTFLLRTGYEQARSVAAALAGDIEAANLVQLVLPETGVCEVRPVSGVASSGCCGGPAPAEVAACCMADAVAKEAGKAGCGCSEAA